MMALSNWEGQAFRNGEHWHEGCDMMLPDAREGLPHTPHAVAGASAIRVGVQKNVPMLYTWSVGKDAWFAEHLVGMRQLWPQHSTVPVTVVGIETPLGGPGVAILIDELRNVWTAVGAYQPYELWCEENR